MCPSMSHGGRLSVAHRNWTMFSSNYSKNTKLAGIRPSRPSASGGPNWSDRPIQATPTPSASNAGAYWCWFPMPWCAANYFTIENQLPKKSGRSLAARKLRASISGPDDSFANRQLYACAGLVGFGFSPLALVEVRRLRTPTMAGPAFRRIKTVTLAQPRFRSRRRWFHGAPAPYSRENNY